MYFYIVCIQRIYTQFCVCVCVGMLSGSQISLPHGPHIHKYSVHLEIIRQIIATNNEGTLRFYFDTISDLKNKAKIKPPLC